MTRFACTRTVLRSSILRAAGVIGVCLAGAVSFLAAQPYGPLQDVAIDAYENGVVITYALPAGYDHATAEPTISRVLFSRDGGALTRLSGFAIDAPLEPATTYQYTLYGADSNDALLTPGVAVVATTLPAAHGITTERVSLDAAGLEREFTSTQPAMSGDGRFIAYAATMRLPPPSSALRTQIFRRDMQTGETILVSRNAAEAASDGDCFRPAISDDGRYVAFLSAGRNLDARDTNTRVDAYLYDHQAGAVTLVTVDAGGSGSATGSVSACVISADGSTVGFLSDATNLHVGATTVARRAYLYNTLTTALTLVPQRDWGYTGYSRPGVVRDIALSADGSLVVFTTNHTHNTGLWGNLQAIWMWDPADADPATVMPVTRNPGSPTFPESGLANPPAVSRNGRYITFFWQKPFTPSGTILAGASPYALAIQYNPYDNAGFVLDRDTGALEVFTLAPAGMSASVAPPQEPPAISDDGRFIAFASSGVGSGPPLVVHNPVPSRSIFVRDRAAGLTVLASRSTAGAYSGTNSDSLGPVISADGSRVAYQSLSTVLVEDDTNAQADVFLTALDFAPPDAEPPVWPGDAALQAVNTGATFVELGWSAATDAGSGLAGYQVFGDGVLIATTGPSERTLQVPGLTPATTYLFRVEAVDAAGNVSSDGPSLQVTTSGSGAASLSAPAFAGGDVHLAWDPAVDPVLGYIVQRRDGSGAWVDVIQVGPATNAYVDAGLPASTAYVYRVLRLPLEGEPEVHTGVAEGATRALEIGPIAYEATRADAFRDLIAIGGAVNVRLDGEVRRVASARITYEAWNNTADPAAGTHPTVVQIALVERAGEAGRYEGAWTLPAGVARITGLTGVLADGHTAELTREATGLPRAVEARYTIAVDGDPAEVAGLVFSLWSETARAGSSSALGGDGLVSGGALPAARDYRLRLLQGSRVVQTAADMALHAGLATVLERSIAPTGEARFTLVDPEGVARGGFVFNMHEPGTDRILGWATVADDGAVHVRPGERYTAGQPVEFRLSGAPWDIDAGPGATVIPASGAVTTVALAWSAVRVPPARITGTITYPDGEPAAVKVSAVSVNPGITSVAHARSGSDGAYVLEPAYGRVFVEVGGEGRDRRLWYAREAVDVSSGSPATLDIVLAERIERTLRIQELELVFPSGRVERIDPSRSPLGARIVAQVIEEGALQAPAQGPANRPLRVLANPGATLTLRVLGARLGLGMAQLPLDPGDSGEIVVPSVRLEAESAAFVVAQVFGRDGQPAGPDVGWNLRLTRTSGEVHIAGAGPRMDVPLPEGEGRLTGWLDGQTGGMVETPVAIGPGRNDLGELRMPDPGAYSLNRYARYAATPRFVPPGRPVHVSLTLVNPLSSTLEGWRVVIDLPDGATVLPGSAVVNNTGVTVEAIEGGVALPMPPVAPGGTAAVRLQLALDPAAPDGDIVLPARLEYAFNEADQAESLSGPRITVVRRPTLSGPESVSATEVALRGISPAGALYILDGAEVIGQTQVGAGGFWSLTTRLAERPVPYWHTLTAVHVDGNGAEVQSDALHVLHDPGQPAPVHVRFRQEIENPVDAEQALLVQQFPDVGDWREFDVPTDGPARFWQRMLAGFPFEFDVEFDAPGRVTAASVIVDGPAGGAADAAVADDGVFRARVISARNVPWLTGPITVEYDDAMGVLPRWINDMALDGPPQIDLSPVVVADAGPLETGSARPYTANDGATDLALEQGFSVPSQELDGRFNFSVRSNQDLTLGATTSLTYPGGVIDYPIATAPAYESSVNWVIEGNRATVDIVMHIPVERIISRDQHAPVWTEDAAVAVTAAGATSVTLGWTPAHDAFWVEQYHIFRDDELIGETEGDVRTLTVSGLEPGTDYAFRVEASDLAGNRSVDNPATIVAFTGESTGAITAASLMRAARPGPDGIDIAFSETGSDKFVKLGIRWVGDFAGPVVDVIGTGKGYLDSRDKLNQWKDMLRQLQGCGASPADQAFFADRITTASESLFIQNWVGTTFTVSSVAFAATGAGAPLSAGLALAGLATGKMLDSIAAREDQATEDAFRSVMDALECEEDEEEKERRRRYSKPRYRRTVADPIWKIDPSGFVFEVSEDNRIAGVTATLLTAPSADGPWVVSAAEEFGEINPQVTLVNGVYAWDVPPGWWRVMYERDGYETAFSEALPVPPPHFDVNIPLRSLAAPAVAAVASTGSGVALRIDFDRHVRIAMLDTATVRVRDALGQPVPGRVEVPDTDRVDDPHTPSTERDITRRVLFIPDERLLPGTTWTLEIDGVIESYAGIPMGATASIQGTVTDDLAGTYSGDFGGGTGRWTLLVDARGSVRFLGYDPVAGRVFDGQGTIDTTGNFTVVAGGATLTGSILDGAVVGQVSGPGAAISGTRSAGEPGLADSTRVHRGAVIGSTGTTVAVVTRPDGTAMALVEGELASGAAVGTPDSAGDLTVIVDDGAELSLALGAGTGLMRGVFRQAGGDVWEVLGAVEGAEPSRLSNVSGRSQVLDRHGSLIAGFVVRGTGEKPMLVRAIGQGLEPLGVSGVLDRPRIRVMDMNAPGGAVLTAENSRWLDAGDRDDLISVFQNLGAFLLDDEATDAAVLDAVRPGLYTAVVESVDGQPGVALVEAYDAGVDVFGNPGSRVVNLSVRGQVGTGHAVMIGGFVIAGDTPRRVLVRGIGPGLSGFGVDEFLPDPTLTLFDGGTPLADNQDWSDFRPAGGLAEVFELVGAFPLEAGSPDAALVMWLAPGAYTVHLQNEQPGGGIGLIEVYDLP